MATTQEDVESELEDADSLFQRQKLGEAYERYTLLCDSEHRVIAARAMTGLGMVELERNNYGIASGWFQRVVDGGHRIATAYYGLGVVTEKNDLELARHCYQQALQINPGHGGAQIRLRRLLDGLPTPNGTSDTLKKKDQKPPDTEFESAAGSATHGGSRKNKMRNQGSTLTNDKVVSRSIIHDTTPNDIDENSVEPTTDLAELEREIRQSRNASNGVFFYKDGDDRRIFHGIAKSSRNIRPESRRVRQLVRTVHVREFVLERVENLNPVSIYMEGETSKGNIVDGDEIEIDRLPEDRGVLETNIVLNVTTGAYVEMVGSVEPGESWFEYSNKLAVIGKIGGFIWTAILIVGFLIGGLIYSTNR